VTKKTTQNEQQTSIKSSSTDQIKIHDEQKSDMIMPKKIYDKNPNRKKSISQLASELDESWDPIFKDPKIISLLHKLDAEFDKELEAFGDHIEILPYDEDDTFKAFKYCE